MIDLFKENIIASFYNIPIIHPQDNYQIAFSHEGLISMRFSINLNILEISHY